MSSDGDFSGMPILLNSRHFLWPFTTLYQNISSIFILALIVVSVVRSHDAAPGLIGGAVYVLRYAMALTSAPSRLTVRGIDPASVRRTLEGMSCAPINNLEPETWVLPAPSWVKPTDPSFRVTFRPNGEVEGPWVVLLRISRRLRAAGAG